MIELAQLPSAYIPDLIPDFVPVCSDLMGNVQLSTLSYNLFSALEDLSFSKTKQHFYYFLPQDLTSFTRKISRNVNC